MTMGRPLGLKLGLLGVGAAGDRSLLLRHDFSTGTLPTGTTFTRTGLALYWDATSGELRWPAHNYVLRSSDFSAWTVTRCTATVDTITEDTSNNSHTIEMGGVDVPSTSVKATVQIELKAGTRTDAVIRSRDTSGSVNYSQARFTLTGAGTASEVTNAGTFTGATASIVALDEGWYRCTLTYVPAVGINSRPSIRMHNGTSDSYLGTGGTLLARKAQGNVGPRATAHVATTTTTSINNEPRFGVTRPGQTRVGYVTEPARTNRIVQSIWPSGFTSWTQTGVPTRVASLYGSDDGASAATFAVSASQVYLTQQFTTANNTEYVFSVEVEVVGDGTLTNADILTVTALPAGCTILGYRLNGNVVASGDAVVVGRLDVVIGGTYTGAATNLHVGAGVAGAAEGTVTLSRPQLESTLGNTLAKASSSTFIPTTTAAVSRNAEVAAITGASFTSSLWNQTEGTVIMDLAIIGGDSLSEGENFTRPGRILWVGDGTTNDFLILDHYNITGVRGVIYDGGGEKVLIADPSATTPSQQRFRCGMAYKLNDTNFSKNGSVGTTDALCTMPTCDRLHLGAKYDGTEGGGLIIYGLETYNVRKDNTALAALTTVV